MNPVLLAIDTSTEACSVAVGCDDGRIFHRYEVAPRRHGDLVLPMIQAVLQEAGIPLASVDVLAYGRGPGAFTGLRIAAGIIQGLAYGAGKPVVEISTLMAMGHRVWREHGVERVHCAIDARMGEVYFATVETFGAGQSRLSGNERVSKPASVWSPDSGPSAGDVAAGTGWTVIDAADQPVPAVVYPDLFPHALDILALARTCSLAGEAVEAARVRPVYLRDDVVQVRVP